MKGIYELIPVWNLIGLNDDGVDKSPYHRLEGNLLELKPFQIDLNQMSQLDRTNLSKVLTKIMVKLFLLDEYSFEIDSEIDNTIEN